MLLILVYEGKIRHTKCTVYVRARPQKFYTLCLPSQVFVAFVIVQKITKVVIASDSVFTP